MTEDTTSRRRWALQLQQPLPTATVFDRVVFLIGAAAAVWLAVIIAIQGLESPWAVLWFLPVWAITAYLVLPRLHRLLSDLYLPDYFFGRTRTADGLLGDPVNLGVDGTAAQLDRAMTLAGWRRADDITLVSTWRIVVSSLTGRSYPTAPVSPLMLFRRRHDVAYEQEVDGNARRRHHVRFWHCPPGWLLPGGARTDWLAAATFDTHVGISFFTLQVTHRIGEDTDVERDHVVRTLRDADPAVTVHVLHDFTSGYHARNGGGDRFVTDGDLPIVDLTAVDAVAQPGMPGDAEPAAVIARAPLSAIVAFVLIALTAVAQVAGLVGGGELTVIIEEDGLRGAAAIGAVLASVVVLLGAQLAMAWMVLKRGRRSRAVLTVLLSLSIVLMAADYLNGSAVLGLDETLLAASVQCAALLALSSESTGAWVRGRTDAAAAAAPRS
ncbi:LssY C-terminal domain-containing protein [Microbacterium sp. 179-I 3D4 NHS]|uniref:LssY C-terminal domain-containing protein n=1 Tax=Microbacterium sp. 179-I 3D4 NHS TaxID=3142381 RepID=UPI0039A3E8BA